MEKEKTFVYARLHNPEIQKKITGTIWDTPVGDSIVGYKKTVMVYNDLSFPIIEPSAPNKADGFVYDLTSDDLVKVDRFLGDAYKRTRMTTEYGTEVWVWVKNEAAFPSEKPYEKPSWLQ